MPEDKFIAVDDLSLHYLDWGNPQAPAVLLLHGITASAHHWDFFASRLAADYHVLAMDLRGHGDSDRAASYTPADYARDLESIVPALALRDMTLIGHSLGGITSTIYAAGNPERVSRLVIVDIGPELSTEGMERLKNAWSEEPEAFPSLEEAVRHMKQNDPLLSATFARHVAEHDLKQVGPGRFAFKHDRAVLYGEVRSPEWMWDYLRQLVCPTLIVHGVESDLFSAGLARKMAGTVASGSAVDIERAGHNVIGDNPEAFASAVADFLHNA